MQNRGPGIFVSLFLSVAQSVEVVGQCAPSLLSVLWGLASGEASSLLLDASWATIESGGPDRGSWLLSVPVVCELEKGAFP